MYIYIEREGTLTLRPTILRIFASRYRRQHWPSDRPGTDIHTYIYIYTQIYLSIYL